MNTFDKNISDVYQYCTFTKQNKSVSRREMRTSWPAGCRRFGAETKSTLDIRINKREERDVALKPKRTKHLLLHRRTRVPRCARAIRPPFLPSSTLPSSPRLSHGTRALPAACHAGGAPTRTWLDVFSLGKIP